MKLRPKAQERLHLVLALVFVVQIPLALFTGLKNSVPYLVFLSLWALVGAHWSAYQAVRAEEKAEQ